MLDHSKHLKHSYLPWWAVALITLRKPFTWSKNKTRGKDHRAPNHQILNPQEEHSYVETGRSHNSLSNCPARGQTCLYCKKPNHFAEVCRSEARRQRFHSLEQAGSQASQTSAESTLLAAFESVVFESIAIAAVSRRESNRYRDEVLVSINLNLPQGTHKNTILKAKLDTGAQGNILPLRLYRQMYPHNLDDHGNLRPVSSSDVILTAYGGSQIKHHGTVTIPCSYKGENARTSFYVTDSPGPAIIALPTSTDLKLLILNFSIEENDPHPATVQFPRTNRTSVSIPSASMEWESSKANTT